MDSEYPGRLQIISGPMFAGKSEELLRRIRRARLAGLGTQLVNHALDDRFDSGQVVSHLGSTMASRTASDAESLLALVDGRGLDLLGVDEAQFFGTDLVDVVGGLLEAGTTVVVAGLSVTFDGGPFEPLPSLMAVAEDVTKLTAVCAVCGRDAAFHRRTADDGVGDATVPTAAHIGGIEAYQARCRRHFSS